MSLALVDRVVARYKVGSTQSILNLILQKVRDERSVTSLVAAYNTNLEEDWEDEHGSPPPFDSLQEKERWDEKELGILASAAKIESEYQKAYVETYLKRISWADRQTALEVMDYPSRLPREGLALTVLRAIARDRATQDAQDALAMRGMAQARR
jgi:hypothetical protein